MGAAAPAECAAGKMNLGDHASVSGCFIEVLALIEDNLFATLVAGPHPDG
jgi:hypothetical protein